jgi:hypothetical protein
VVAEIVVVAEFVAVAELVEATFLALLIPYPISRINK